MSKSKVRLFYAGNILLVLVAIAHTAALFSDPPPDPAAHSVVRAMGEYRLELGLGMRPSIMELQNTVGLTMSFLLLLVVSLNLAVLRSPEQSPVLCKRAAKLSAVFTWAIALLAMWYQVPPPLISFTLAAIFFTAAGFGRSDTTG